MKKILILGLLLVSSLWGLKEWNSSICTSLNCSDEEQGLVPKIPDDYKPQKGDRVIKVKVGKTEGVIINVPDKGLFIKTSNEKSYLYSGFSFGGNPKSIFFIDYPNYKVMVAWGNWEFNNNKGKSADFYQIFEAGNKLRVMKSKDFSISCVENKDSSCSFLTKEYILDWIKKQGGQKFFDNACPPYFESQDLEMICKNGIVRLRKCEELNCNPFTGCPDCSDDEIKE